MIDVIFNCEIGKRAHRYHPLIKNSMQEYAEIAGFPLGYFSKVEQCSIAPAVAILNCIHRQSGVWVSCAASLKCTLTKCD
jgi:hypothetical protein